MAKGDVKTYSAKEVIIAFGSHAVSGVADDSFVTIEPNGDGMAKQVGCYGEIARSIDPDTTYKVTLSLLQTSETNKFLQSQLAKDEDTGEGMFPVLIKDLKGNLMFQAEYGWIVKAPSRAYGKTTNNRDWEIDTGDATLTDD